MATERESKLEQELDETKRLLASYKSTEAAAQKRANASAKTTKRIVVGSLIGLAAYLFVTKSSAGEKAYAAARAEIATRARQGAGIVGDEAIRIIEDVERRFGVTMPESAKRSLLGVAPQAAVATQGPVSP